MFSINVKPYTPAASSISVTLLNVGNNACLLLCHQLVWQFQVSANFQPRIQIEDFSNPANELANGSCCSDSSMQMSDCPAVCDERVRVCFRSTDHPADDTESCPLLEIENIETGPPRGLILGVIEKPWPGVSYI